MRVFITEVRQYPRGSAGANYVNYLAKALLGISGCEVIVLGTGKNRTEDYDNQREAFFYDNIEYFNQDIGGNRRKEAYKFYQNILARYGVRQDDFYILYSHKLYALLYLMKKIPVTHLAVCRVEEYQPAQFKLGRFNPKVIEYRLADKIMKQQRIKQLPISTYIDDLHSDWGCESMVLPIMSDPHEYSFCLEKERGAWVEMIYPGVKVTDFEDDIPLLLEALGNLSERVLGHLCIHMTGITMERFNSRYPGTDKVILERIVFHSWMSYDELIELYKKMDYLLLVRKINPITKANFPSKVPELLSFGVVPICTDVGDYTKYYLHDNDTCILIHGQKSTQVAAAIEKAVHLTNEDYLRMRRNARELSENKFCYKNWTGKLEQFLFGDEDNRTGENDS